MTHTSGAHGHRKPEHAGDDSDAIAVLRRLGVGLVRGSSAACQAWPWSLLSPPLPSRFLLSP